MADERKRTYCPDCEGGVDRRHFLATVGGAALAAGSVSLLGNARRAEAAPSPSSKAETTVKALYGTLTDSQKKVVVLPWADERRTKINANWMITEPEIASDFYTNEQRDLADKVFRGVTSGDGYEKFQKQMKEDDGGFGNYSMAFFGTPDSGKFEWELTGRHLTIRADGNSTEGAAFGGPIIYGHGTGDSVPGLPGNVFYDQVKKANELYQALDGKQRRAALLDRAPTENAVLVQGKDGKFPGLAGGELSADQKELLEQTIKIMLAPYREEDVKEAVAVVKAGGGLDKLRLSFYKTDADGDPDLGEDGEWEVWRVEGPTFVWHFRGAPHVHTYVNITTKV